MDSEVRDNREARRYELIVDGQLAHADYVIDGDVVTFIHTVVPRELEGRGIAGRLIAFALADLKTRGLRVVAQCPFVAADDGLDRDRLSVAQHMRAQLRGGAVVRVERRHGDPALRAQVSRNRRIAAER